ncbi:unnamed protein product [Pedinophyceae sp. YPF-701]|nr:unnamed protein product [Pedinophyceae sp. YPF-701]
MPFVCSRNASHSAQMPAACACGPRETVARHMLRRPALRALDRSRRPSRRSCGHLTPRPSRCRLALLCAASARGVADSDTHVPLQGCSTVILDCDGVLWRGDQVIPGAVEAIRKMRDAGKQLLFVTNNASKSRWQYAEKFASLGMEVAPEEVVPASYAAAAYLDSVGVARDGGRVYLIGGRGVETELEHHGIPFVGGVAAASDPADMSVEEMLAFDLDPSVRAVLIGYDAHFTYRKIATANLYLRSDPSVRLVGTNGDAADRIDDERMMAGTGGLVAAVEVASGRTAHIVGKGGPWLLPFLCGQMGVDPANACIVGDRMDTDIALGKDGGLRTILTLTGVTRAEDLRHMSDSELPDVVLDSIADITRGL